MEKYIEVKCCKANQTRLKPPGGNRIMLQLHPLQNHEAKKQGTKDHLAYVHLLSFPVRTTWQTTSSVKNVFFALL